MQTFHSFTRSNKTYRLVYDELYDLADIDEDTVKGLEDGSYVVLGCIVTEACPGVLPVNGTALHCACCSENGRTITSDSLWGIIIKPSTGGHLAEFEQEILSILGHDEVSA